VKSEKNLSVTERLRAAAAFHFAESPGFPLSVSKLCATANVNRANAYERHRELVRELTQRHNAQDGKRKTSISKDAEEQRVRRETAFRIQALEYKALLNLCIEQMAEIRSLRLKVQSLTEVGSRKR